MSEARPSGPLCCLVWWRGPMGAGLSARGDDGRRRPSAEASMAEAVRERKRKVNGGLATLRRRLAGRRGGGEARRSDRAAPLRELLKEWSRVEVGALLEEYDALAALRDLCVQAELARPPAPALRQDLRALYERRICCDAELASFPVHRAVLAARCPYFRETLQRLPAPRFPLRLDAPPPAHLDPPSLDALLKYLYAGETCSDASLRRIAADLGATPNLLRRDLRHLLESAEFADASLVFTSEPPPQPARRQDPDCPDPKSARAGSPPSSSEYGFRPRLELPCHRAILSARSPFFRNLIQRRSRLQGNAEDSYGPVKIVLDERVIPHKYARVLLHAVYTDQVDLNLIMRGGNSIFGCSILGNHNSNPNDLQVSVNNQQQGNPSSVHCSSPLEEAMELYEIGRFIELDILSQGCEDIIAERLSAESLAAVLKWSAQPHGSKWVHRQSLRFLREEFLTVASGPALPLLEASHLAHALRCPFLQASELDALKATLRWGEYRLIKRMEDREPNLLSHTAHSVTRKGVKKRDLSDTELRELLSDLLPLVRMDHILPPNNELLNQAIRRGLLSSPPSYMLGDEGSSGSRADAWIRGKGGLYVRPRLYMPYYEEVKALLEDQMVQEADLVRMRRARYIPDIPDTLYMVSAEPRARSSASGAPVESPQGGAGSNDVDGNSRSGDGNTSGNTNNSDVTASVPPAPATMRAMLARERELRRAPACIRATSLPLSHTAEINRQIRLRVVREFNLPDSVADTLEGAAIAFEGSYNSGRNSPPCVNMGSGRIRDCCMEDSDLHLDTANRLSTSMDEDANRQFAIAETEDTWNGDSPRINRGPLPSLLTEGDPNRSHSADSSRQHKYRATQQSGRGLSEVMPDVAMATSSLGRLRISAYNQQQQHPQQNLTLLRNSGHCLEHTAESDMTTNNSFCVINRDPKGTCENHSLSRDSSAAHTPVTFMNPNQHLLQEGCSLGTFNYKSREGTRKSQKHQNPNFQRGSSENARFQCNEHESSSLQLDLGDGNQHSSPGKLFSPLQQTSRHNQNYDIPPNDKMRMSELSHQSQKPISNPCSTNTNYSRYLSSQTAITHNNQNDQGKKQAQPTLLNSPAPTSSSSMIPTSPFRIIGGPLTAVNTNNAYVQQNNGFSTLQHHSRSRSPRHLHANVTLQRPRPICPNVVTPVYNSATNICSGGSNNCAAIQCSTALANACSRTENVEKDIHRSQSAGSVSSLSLERDKQENKVGKQNVSGYNHPLTYGESSLPAESSNQLSLHNSSNSYGHVLKEASPRHFHSISSFLDQVNVYSESSNCRSTNYQIGANLIESSVNRNQYETLPNWIQQGNQCVSGDERNQYFLRNSKDNFYGQGYSIQREGSFIAMPSNSSFQGEGVFPVGIENYNCLPQTNRPSSCGLVDVISSYNNSSRGESPLYGGMNPSSRGNSPFRTLDGTIGQFSRQNSPYSSSHRMDYGSRMQGGDNYCQSSMQSSSNPSPRISFSNKNISNSSSGLKIQPQHSSRNISNSPSCNVNQPSQMMSKTRNISESPTGSYPLLKQSSRSISNSPSMNIDQGSTSSNMKMHPSVKNALNSPSMSTPLTLTHSSLKSHQRSSPNPNSKVEAYSNLTFGQQQQMLRDEAKSQTLRLSSSQYHIGTNTPPKFL